MPPFTPYAYRADIVRVIDGDTFEVVFDVGFGLSFRQRVRLPGIDTAEIYGVSTDSDEYDRGMAHKEFVEEWVASALAEVSSAGWPLYGFTYKDQTGKYGRYLADFAPVDEPDSLLSDALRAEYGDAVAG